ncbi:unnamed protein product [Camellia sinensis]
MMTRKTSSSCAVCETSNLASICALCQLQCLWQRVREKLQSRREQYSQGKGKVEKMSYDLKVKYELLESARTTHGHYLETSSQTVNIDGERKDGSSGQYDQICNARLPRGLDSHSIPSEVLAASLGYMVQLLNLVVHNVAAPALHNLGFAKVHAPEYGNETLIGMPVRLPEGRKVIKTSSTIEQISMECEFKKHLQSSAASFPYATESSDIGKNENLIEGWDLVEHPTFPPPPSQTEDVEHWTRAVFIDATKK